MKKAVDRARVDFRLTADQKALFEHAASIEGQTLSEFLVRSADERARTIIRDHDVLVLRGADAERIVSLLMDPPPPNEALKRAFKHYFETVDPTSE